MALAGRQQISDQDVRTTATQIGNEFLGQYAATADGRTFQYGANTSTSLALSPGKLAQGAVSTANHVNQTGVTTKVGDSSVVYAVGATAVTADQYRGGYLVVNAGTGAGQALLIRGNTKAASSGSPTIYLKDFIITATAVADSKFSLHPHPYSACLIMASASSTSALPVGVPNVSIPAATTALPNSCGWFQVGGPASVLANGTPALASGIIASATTDGAFDVEATTTVTTRLGYMLITAVSTEYRPAWLTINAG